MVKETELSPQAVQAIAKVLKHLLRKGPRQCGYQSPFWTILRLSEEIQRETGIKIPPRIVRRVIHQVRQQAVER